MGLEHQRQDGLAVQVQRQDYGRVEQVEEDGVVLIKWLPGSRCKPAARHKVQIWCLDLINRH